MLHRLAIFSFGVVWLISNNQEANLHTYCHGPAQKLSDSFMLLMVQWQVFLDIFMRGTRVSLMGRFLAFFFANFAILQKKEASWFLTGDLLYR